MPFSYFYFLAFVTEATVKDFIQFKFITVLIPPNPSV